MDREITGEIVLLTGSSGFLGRHVLKFLLQDDKVVEIRALDKNIPCNNNEGESGYKDARNKIKFHHCDLLNKDLCRDAFRDVDFVIHCAGLVNYEYPPDVEALDKNNVKATENVVQLCIEENVRYLIHCSTTEVTLQSCFRGGIVAVSIFKQESKLEIPQNYRRLIFGEYAASKLKAEKIVLQSHGTLLNNGKGTLVTVAVRPTMLYGEGDPHLLPKILRMAKSRGDYLPRISGSGGKQQITYVGNAAWSFIRALETLRTTPHVIAGLPVTVTDDTLVDDLVHFCERMTRSANDRRIKVSSWPVPLSLSYLAAVIAEFLSDFGFIRKFEVPPCSIVAYLGSIILYNRARASIHMNYWPKYNHEQTIELASKYYSELCVKNHKS